VVVNVVKKLVAFYDPEILSPCSQDPIIGPYSQQIESSTHSLILFIKIHFNVIVPSSSRHPFTPETLSHELPGLCMLF
jgi:hypothetical protein